MPISPKALVGHPSPSMTKADRGRERAALGLGRCRCSINWSAQGGKRQIQYKRRMRRKCLIVSVESCGSPDSSRIFRTWTMASDTATEPGSRRTAPATIGLATLTRTTTRTRTRMNNQGNSARSWPAPYARQAAGRNLRRDLRPTGTPVRVLLTDPQAACTRPISGQRRDATASGVSVRAEGCRFRR